MNEITAELAQDWVPEEKEISINDIENLIKKMDDAEVDYEGKKRIASEANAVYEGLRKEVLEMLQKAGKDKYSSNLGTVSVVNTVRVKVPKEFNDKQALLDWLNAQGSDMYLTYATVNSQSLNSLYKKLFEEAEDKASFKIPGVEAPVSESDIRFRRSKK
jgi:carboxypeptidase C (cathepsin A)